MSEIEEGKLIPFTIDEMRYARIHHPREYREMLFHYDKWRTNVRKNDKKILEVEKSRINNFLNKDKLNIRRKAYREANKDKLNIRQKAYYEANKDKISARQKAYREANKDKISARQKAYYEANKDKLNIKKKAYREANKDKLKARMNNNRKKTKIKRGLNK